MASTSEEIKSRLLEHIDTIKVKIRFNDTDAMGVVHFKNYMVYFDDGFVSFMNSIGGKRPVEQSIHDGIALGVKHVDITYENSAIFGDYVLVKTKIINIGNKSITFHHEIFKESTNERLVDVKATRFALNLKSKKLLNIIEYFKDFLSEI